MRAVAYEGAGGREVVAVQDRPVPSPGPGEVVIRVAAAGINRADLLQRAGNYPVPEGASDLPGLEVSGTIEEAGAGVGNWDFGTPVCALLAGGGYAEYVAVPAGQVVPVPDGVSLTDAAGLPEVAATCWSNLVMEAGVQSGDWVLVHGGTGGIGSFALQLLQALGARPIATAGSPEKMARSLELGAEAAINHREEDFVARVREITDGHGADVILDVMGAKYLTSNVKTLARGGQLVVIGLQGGTTGDLPLGAVMGKNAVVTGTMLRPRPVAEKSEIMRQVAERVWPLVSNGAIRATTDSTFPLEQAAQAQDRFEESDRTGKVLLVTGEGR
ncbi:NAD(P)H-quinone oxidoreductase [Citricoccus nitrophenolicus]